MKKCLFLTFAFLIFSFQGFSQKVYESKHFEFSIQEPRKWFIAGNKELNDNLKKIEMTEDELAKLLKTNNNSILLGAFYKYNPKTTSGLIPTIQINVRPNNTKDFEGFRLGLNNSAMSLKQYFSDFEFIENLKEIEVSNIKSLYFIGKFTLQTQDGQTMKVRSRTYAIPYKNYFFQINFTDGQTGEDCTKEFDELVKTIKIGK